MDPSGTAPDTASGTESGGRPVGFALALVLLFAAAVVLGRLLVAGGALWILVLLAIPILLVLLGRAVGVPAAIVVLVVFVLVVLASRSLLSDPRAGWVPFVLVPIAAIMTGLAVAVVRSLVKKSV